MFPPSSKNRKSEATSRKTLRKVEGSPQDMAQDMTMAKKDSSKKPFVKTFPKR